MIQLKYIDKELKSKLIILLKNTPRVDITIETLFDNEYPKFNIKVFLDNTTSPKVVLILQGTFVILAGDTKNLEAVKVIKEIPPKFGIQPTSKEWIDLAKKIHKENLKCNTRFSFSSSSLNKKNLEDIIANHEFSKYLKQIDLNLLMNIKYIII